MLRTVSAGPTIHEPAIVGFSTEAPTTPVMPSSSITSETMPLASPSARKPSMMPCGGRGVSIKRIRSVLILPVSFFCVIEVSGGRIGSRKLRHDCYHIRARHRHIMHVTEACEQRKRLQHLLLIIMCRAIHRNIDMIIPHAEAHDRALDTVARRDAGHDHAPFAGQQFHLV